MRKFLLLSGFLFIIARPSSATTYYVDAAQTNNNGSGTSWATAKKDLQDALNMAVAGDSVLVAEGTYYPTEFFYSTTTDPRDKSFFLDEDITLIGGFPSGGGPAIGDPRPSILSGDLGVYGDSTDNSYHVFITAGLTQAATIRGFVIMHGQADGSGTLYFSGESFDRSFGGGLHNRHSSPEINSVVIAHNYATYGGGMYNYNANVSLRNSVICFNSANTSGGIRNWGATVSFTNITVAFNSANNEPGISVHYNTLAISNSVIYGNNATTSCSQDVCMSFATILSGSKKNASDISNGTLSSLPGYQQLNSNPFAGTAAGPDGIFMTKDDGLRPKFGSKLINNGGALLAQPDTIDITGIPRQVGGFVDIGAYEYNCVTYGSASHKSCNTSFIGPSGKNFSNSGIYNDTLQNAQGCDSIIRLDVKVNPRVIYVDASRPDNSGDGYSWAAAKRDLQNGLDLALTDTGCDTVKVAKGTYYPTESPDGNTTNPRNFTFHIDRDMVLLGGYPSGGGNPDFKGLTILSGDIGTPGNKNDNCHHVFITANLTSASLIKGFTIRDGQADDLGAIGYAGYIFQSYYSGGMCNYYSSPVLSHLIFENNEASLGGGIYNFFSSPVISNSVLNNNLAYSIGGGVRNWSSNAVLKNVVFSNNEARNQSGGGLANGYTSSVELSNVVFFSNTTSQNGSGLDNDNSTTLIFNTVFYGNGANTIDNRNGGTITAVSRNNASDVAGGLTGTANLVTLMSNPFLDTNSIMGGDSLWMTADDGLRPAPGSPLIDAGTISILDSTTFKDLAGMARIYNDSVDIGPYENGCSGSSGIKISQCGSYTSPGGRVITQSGIYTDTLTIKGNCDSIVTLNVTINHAATFYVDASRPDNSGDGTSWASAKKDLQDAIDLASASNGCNIIKMAEGVYYPTVLLDSSSTDPRDKSFAIAKDLTISGGYPSGGGSANPQKYNTILSGDIGVLNDSTDNCYHVMVMYGLSATAKLENLIIRDGNAYGSGVVLFAGNSFSRYEGGAISMDESSPQLSELIIANNWSDVNGNISLSRSSPLFSNVLFIENHGTPAVDNDFWSEPVIKNSTFYNNSEGIGGYDIILYNCVFYQNGNDFWGRLGAASSNNASDIDSSYYLSPSTNFVPLNTDPFLNAADPIGPDGIWMTSDDGLQPRFTSELVDMGAKVFLPYTDLAGGIRVSNDIPDIGAYELNCSNGVFRVNDTLIANTPNASYQWIDCDANFAAIPGATSQFYIPQVNGSYAVVIDNGGCLDTSSCLTLNDVSLPDGKIWTDLKIYPNPTRDNINLILNESTSSSVQVDIFNSLGQRVDIHVLKATKNIELPLPHQKGIYFLKIQLEGKSVVQKVVKE